MLFAKSVIHKSPVTATRIIGKNSIVVETIFNHALPVAIFTLLWEILLRKPFLWGISWMQERVQRQNLFPRAGDVLISKSFPTAIASRQSDNIVEGLIRRRLSGRIENVQSAPRDEVPSVDFGNLHQHLIVIGSPRYNKYAALIQENFSLGVEFVTDSYAPDPGKRVLKIVNASGAEFASSLDLDDTVNLPGVDYAIVFRARLAHRKTVFWVAGIHGIGTRAAHEFIAKHALEFYMPPRGECGNVWLLRVNFVRSNVPDATENVTEVKIVDSEGKCKRRLNENRPQVLICDLGNVIMFFDRDRTYRALGHQLGVSHTHVKELLESSNLVEEYENGAIEDAEFFSRANKILKFNNKVTPDLFEEFWGDIFWPNQRMIDALTALKPQVKLILLSNTNGMHFRNIKEHYPEIINLFDGRLILSYQEKASKPNVRVFEAAMRAGGPHVSPRLCMYVDDKREYVEKATGIGMRAHHFISYPHFVFSMRQAGFLLP
jgi:FMN phosphatase YigB (HAD superfamily)